MQKKVSLTIPNVVQHAAQPKSSGWAYRTAADGRCFRQSVQLVVKKPRFRLSHATDALYIAAIAIQKAKANF